VWRESYLDPGAHGECCRCFLVDAVRHPARRAAEARSPQGTLLDYVRRADAGALLVTLGFGGMPHEVANANYERFAREVLPARKGQAMADREST
jgi:hypothetical protein